MPPKQSAPVLFGRRMKLTDNITDGLPRVLAWTLTCGPFGFHIMDLTDARGHRILAGFFVGEWLTVQRSFRTITAALRWLTAQRNRLVKSLTPEGR